MTVYRPVLALLFAAFVAVPAAVHAKTTTSTMIARTKVDTACKLQTTNLTFGGVNLFSGQVDASTTMALTCGPAVAYSIAIDNGQNYNGQRRMLGNTFFGQLYLPYQLYRNAARTQVWGATPTTMLNGTTPANGKATLTVYGRLPNSLVLNAVYLDTVTVTVNF